MCKLVRTIKKKISFSFKIFLSSLKTRMLSQRIDQLIINTDKKVLESTSLLQLIFNHQSSAGPDYLDRLLNHLDLHVNFIYADPLYTLLTSLKDTLLSIRESTGSVSVDRAQSAPSDGLELDTDLYRTPQVALTNETQVSWGSLRPPELGDAPYIRDDAQLLLSPTTEIILANGRQYISLLLKYGLNQERLEYADEEEASKYLAIPLYLFKYSNSSRIRHYALDLMTQLFTMGLDIYTDVVIEALFGVIRDGAFKVVDVYDMAESAGDNFDKCTEFLTALFRVGFDINHQYMKALTFSDEFGLPTHESEDEVRIETVRYTSLSVLTLCSIYNRVDVIAWVLNFAGALPIDPMEEVDLTSRTLDLDNHAYSIQDGNDLKTDPQYLTFILQLRTDTSAIPEKCDLLTIQDEEKTVGYTALELAVRHRSVESTKLLQDYQEYLTRQWTAFDPMTQDVRDIGYEMP